MRYNIDYKYSRKLYHYETDADGVCHASNYIRLFEEAMENFFVSRDYINENQLVISFLQIKYIKPIKKDAYFNIYIKYIDLARASFTFYVIITSNDNEPLTEMKIKIVEVSLNTSLPLPISKEFKFILKNEGKNNG